MNYWKLGFILGIGLAANNVWACSSDFDCGIGSQCVKAPFESSGACMKSVDEDGVRQYNMPDLDSVGPNMNTSGECDFSTDCPVGFQCDSRLKVCVQ